MKKWFEEGEYSEWLEKLEKSLPEGAISGFCVGNKLSYADFSIWNLLFETFDDKVSSGKVSEKYTVLNTIAKNVAANPKLKLWLESRPQTKF